MIRRVSLVLAAMMLVGCMCGCSASGSTATAPLASSVTSSVAPSPLNEPSASHDLEKPILPSAAPSPTVAASPISVPSPGPSFPDTEYDLTIQLGLHPKWNAQAASNTVMKMLIKAGRGLVPSDVLSIQVVSGPNLPREFGGPDPEDAIVWIVTANGLFLESHGYTPHSGTSGYYTFDDHGDVIGYGFQGD
jgi:hypothetical protein